MRINPIIMED